MLEANGEWLYNLAAATGFIAYLMTNVLWLRILLVVGACVYIVTGVVIGLTSMIGWHVAYAIINLVHVVILIMDKHGTSLPDSLKHLYSTKFHSIKPREFKRLLAVNAERHIVNKTLLEQGQENGNLYLIISGNAVVELDGKQVGSLSAGDFFGAMSVLGGRVTSSTVRVEGSVQMVHWSKQDLERLERKNLSLYNRFMMAVGLNLIDKLHTTTEEQSKLVA